MFFCRFFYFWFAGFFICLDQNFADFRVFTNFDQRRFETFAGSDYRNAANLFFIVFGKQRKKFRNKTMKFFLRSRDDVFFRDKFRFEASKLRSPEKSRIFLSFFFSMKFSLFFTSNGNRESAYSIRIRINRFE